ncbi:MAG TPA: hypothetical protein VIF62_10750 [Labilithrix sp.]
MRNDGVLEVVCARCHRRARLFCRIDSADVVLARAGWENDDARRLCWRCPACATPPPSSGPRIA